MWGKLTVRLRSIEYIMISHPVLTRLLKATRDPSGETRGASEIDPIQALRYE